MLIVANIIKAKAEMIARRQVLKRALSAVAIILTTPLSALAQRERIPRIALIALVDAALPVRE